MLQQTPLVRFRLRAGLLSLFLAIKIGVSLYWLSRPDWYPSLVLPLDFLAGAALMGLRHLWFRTPSPYQLQLKAMTLLGLFSLILLHNYHLLALGYPSNDLFFVAVMVAAFDFGVSGGLITGMGSLAAVLAISLAEQGGAPLEGSILALVMQHTILYAGISLVAGRLVGEMNIDRERYRLIVVESENPVVRVDSRGRITLLNHAAQRLTGVTEEQALGRSRDLLGNLAGRALQTEAEERAVPYAIDDGEERFFLVDTYLVRSPAGKVTGAFAIYKEVTEVKRKEAALQEANERLRELTVTDDLTGLGNRRLCDQRLREEWLRIRRTGDPLTVILLDVDHFKQINDTYGHTTGDLALQSVSAALKQSIRETDFAFRYGGEEFLIMLPDTPLREAEPVAERLRQAVETIVVQAGGERLRVTVSLGAAACEGGARGEYHDLINRADAALYRAKEAGRNQVCLA
ncbi:MAG: sensor domain-containing diguanylate cyclase [Bacillota bacterium]